MSHTFLLTVGNFHGRTITISISTEPHTDDLARRLDYHGSLMQKL
jgi:hypothetical protein